MTRKRELIFTCRLVIAEISLLAIGVILSPNMQTQAAENEPSPSIERQSYQIQKAGFFNDDPTRATLLLQPDHGKPFIAKASCETIFGDLGSHRLMVIQSTDPWNDFGRKEYFYSSTADCRRALGLVLDSVKPKSNLQISLSPGLSDQPLNEGFFCGLKVTGININLESYWLSIDRAAEPKKVEEMERACAGKAKTTAPNVADAAANDSLPSLPLLPGTTNDRKGSPTNSGSVEGGR